MLWKILALAVSVFSLVSIIAWFYSFRKFLNKNSDKRLNEVSMKMSKYVFVFYTIIFLTIVIGLVFIIAKYMF